jgi:hypothetical protein
MPQTVSEEIRCCYDAPRIVLAEQKPPSCGSRLARVPAHTHASAEELRLLDGELWIDGRKVGLISSGEDFKC